MDDMMWVNIRIRSIGFYVLAFCSGALLIQLWYIHPQGVPVNESPPNVFNDETDDIKQKDLAMTDLMGPNIRYDNPKLLMVLKEYFFQTGRLYITKVSFPLYKTPQAAAVDKILGQKRNGYFVECGALDGERSSNTIWLELKRGWTGLLVEMDPSYYMQLRGKNRKVHSMNACLSPKNYTTQIFHAHPARLYNDEQWYNLPRCGKQLGWSHVLIYYMMVLRPIKFQEHMKGSGKLLQDQGKESSVIHKTYCFPLVSVMLALGVTHIDYLSLDVEGVEFDILKTIPFDKLDISVLSVEYLHVKNRNEMVEFMGKNGYILKDTVSVKNPQIHLYAKDYIFAKG